MPKKLLAWLATIAACVASVPVAAASLIVNGDFELSSAGSAAFGSLYPSNTVAGWETNGYNFIMGSGTADTSGSAGPYGTLYLWGPDNGSANGLTDSSPTGGNYLAADGGLPGLTLAVTQQVNGLTTGKDYVVSFWWAAAQQYTYDGPTQESWTVSLGSQSYTTQTVTTPEHGFQPWRLASFTFTAQNSSDTLSFLANGTPVGQPPFSLLDGVSLEEAAVPEPATWAMMIFGFGIAGAAMRNRREFAGIRNVFQRRSGLLA